MDIEYHNDSNVRWSNMNAKSAISEIRISFMERSVKRPIYTLLIVCFFINIKNNEIIQLIACFYVTSQMKRSIRTAKYIGTLKKREKKARFRNKGSLPCRRRGLLCKLVEYLGVTGISSVP